MFGNNMNLETAVSRMTKLGNKNKQGELDRFSIGFGENEEDIIMLEILNRAVAKHKRGNEVKSMAWEFLKANYPQVIDEVREYLGLNQKSVYSPFTSISKTAPSNQPTEPVQVQEQPKEPITIVETPRKIVEEPSVEQEIVSTTTETKTEEVIENIEPTVTNDEDTNKVVEIAKPIEETEKERKRREIKEKLLAQRG